MKVEVAKRYLRRAESDFASAAGTAAHVAVMTRVAEPVGEFRFETELAGGVQLDAGLPLLLAALSDGRLEQDHFVRLSPARRAREQINYFIIARAGSERAALRPPIWPEIALCACIRAPGGGHRSPPVVSTPARR